MRVAIILPSLAIRGPILIANCIVKELIKEVQFEVFYFDNIVELDFPCKTTRISFFKKIDFKKFDIIHTHQLRPDAYIIFHKIKIPKSCKTISTVHQEIYQDLAYSYNKFTSIIFGYFWLRLLKSFHQLVALTNIAKEELKKSNKKITVIHNGVSVPQTFEEISNEDVEKITQLKQKYKIIGVSALLIKRKGIDQILKAMVNLLDYGLICLGDGAEKKNLIQLAIDLQIEDRIIFLGFRQQGFRYFKYFDVYVISSFSEGFPIAGIEAAEARLPMVCSSIPVLKEIYSENEVCFFEPNNIQSLSEAIKNCYLNKEILSKNIKDKYNKELSAIVMGENYLNLYKKVLNK